MIASLADDLVDVPLQITNRPTHVRLNTAQTKLAGATLRTADYAMRLQGDRPVPMASGEEPILTTPAQPPDSGFWAQLGESAGQLGELAHATGTAVATPAGGYSFEPDELIAIAHEWEDLAEAYATDKRQADHLARVEGPGAEYASNDNAMLVRRSGERLLSTLDERIDYCRSQVEKFRTAAGRYADADADADAGAEISGQGGSL